jgi:hypothetical protein
MSQSLKEEVHQLIDKMPDDSQYLRDLLETLRLNQAIAEAQEDVKAGRLISADDMLKWAEEKCQKYSTT